MSTTDNWLIHDHHKYDEMLTECEMAAEMADWKDAIRLFNQFTTELNLHMQLEDEVLYPILRTNKMMMTMRCPYYMKSMKILFGYYVISFAL